MTDRLTCIHPHLSRITGITELLKVTATGAISLPKVRNELRKTINLSISTNQAVMIVRKKKKKGSVGEVLRVIVFVLFSCCSTSAFLCGVENLRTKICGHWNQYKIHITLIGTKSL